MSESEDTVEFSKKRKRNDEEEGQDQVLSFPELKSCFDKKFEDINEKKFPVETKHLAKRINKPAVPSINYKGNRIQHEFNLNLIEDMEVLIRLIQKSSISRATKAVKNMIADLQKRNKLI